jgi:hypothetical protein
MVALRQDNPSFVLHGIEDVKIEEVSSTSPYFLREPH